MTNPIAEKTATAIKTYLEVAGTGGESIMHHLTRLMGNNTDRFLIQYFNDFMYTCETLLILITKPEVSKLLVTNNKENIGGQLLGMMDFFRSLSYSEAAQAELDLWTIQHHTDQAEWIEGEADYYNKMLLAHKAERQIRFGESK